MFFRTLVPRAGFAHEASSAGLICASHCAFGVWFASRLPVLDAASLAWARSSAPRHREVRAGGRAMPAADSAVPSGRELMIGEQSRHDSLSLSMRRGCVRRVFPCAKPLQRPVPEQCIFSSMRRGSGEYLYTCTKRDAHCNPRSIYARKPSAGAGVARPLC